MLVASPASFPKKVLRLAPDARLLPAPVPPKVLLSESLLRPLDIPVKLEPSPYSVSKYPLANLTELDPILFVLSDQVKKIPVESTESLALELEPIFSLLLV